MSVRVKKNVQQGYWSGGIFRPIRASEDYDPQKAGDNDDVFEREIRRLKNQEKADEIWRQQEENRIKRDMLGSNFSNKMQKTLSQFTRQRGGINSQLEADAKERLSWKAINKKGLALPNGKHSIDELRELAVEAGYYQDWEEASDIVADIEADARGHKKKYPNLVANPKGKRKMVRRKTKTKKPTKRQIDVAAGHLAKVLGTTKTKAKQSLSRIVKNPDGQPALPFGNTSRNAIKANREAIREYLSNVSWVSKGFGTAQEIRLFQRLNNAPQIPVKEFRRLLIIEIKASRKKIRVELNPKKKNPFIEKMKGAVKRGRARRKAKRALGRKLKLEAKLKKTSSALSKAQRDAVSNPKVGLGDIVKVTTLKNNPSFEIEGCFYNKKSKTWFYLCGKRWRKEKDIRRIRKANPPHVHPLMLLSTGLSSVAQAYTIKKLMEDDARRNTPKPKKRRKKANPVRSKAYESFQGRKPKKTTEMAVSHFAPKRLAQLGDLIEIKLVGQREKLDFTSNAKTNPHPFKLCTNSRSTKLWIAGRKIAKKNPKLAKSKLEAIGEIDHVVYGTRKPHHGDNDYTHYIHKLGEETGERPMLCIDREGYPVMHGGAYKIEARGIVN